MSRRARLGVVLVTLVAATMVHGASLAVPSNDEFPGETIASLPSVSTYQLEDATAAKGEPTPSCLSDPVYRSVWYTYTASSPMSVAAHALPDTYGVAVAVFAGESFKTMTEVACQVVWAWNQGTTVMWEADPGTAYHIQVSGYPYSIEDTGVLEVFEAVPPENDSFETRTLLSGFPLSYFAGNNVAATLQPGEPTPDCIGSSTSQRSMWFEWTAQSTERIVVDLIDSHRYSALSVYQGSQLESLTQRTCVAYGYPRALDVVAGETYLFQATGISKYAGEVTLNLNPQVPGDDFTQAIDATIGTNTVRLLRSTTEGGEPNSCMVGGTVWLTLTGYSGVLEVSIPSQSPNPYLAIYESDVDNRLTCSRAYSSPDYVEFHAEKVYYLQLSGWPTRLSAAAPEVSFTLTPVPPPTHDDFDSPEPLTLATTGDNKGATLQVGESQPSCVTTGATVWYRWTAPVTRPYVIDLFGSDFDTTLTIYSGSSLDSLTERACNDDHNSYQSRVVLDAIQDEVYYLQVGGFKGARGNISVNVGIDPTNDDFSEAEEVTGLAYTDTLQNSRATEQPGEPRPSCNSDYTINTVWYKLPSQTSGLIEVDTLGSSFDTVVAVYSGDHLQNLTQIACNDEIALLLSSSTITFTAQPDTNYFIQIGGWKRRWSSDESRAKGTLVMRVVKTEGI